MMNTVTILALTLILLCPNIAKAEDFCEKCDYDSCNTDKNAFNKCKHCHDLDSETFEACRQGAQDAGFLKGAFKESDKLAEAKGYTVKDVAKKMEDLKQLIGSIQRNIALLQTSSTKDKLQRNAVTTLEFWERYEKETGLASPEAQRNPNAPVKWAHERYTPILGGAFLLNGETAAAIHSQAKLMVKKKIGFFGKLFRRDKMKLMNTKLAALEQYIPLIKNDKEITNQIKYAQSINKTYTDLLKIIEGPRKK
jgi:hypothetical protein